MSANEEPVWMAYYKEGMQFFSAAVKPGKKRIFTPILIYNIVCMSIEKLFMAFFFYNNRMPENHTMRDLIESAAKFRPIDKVLMENMIFLDGFQDICPVYTCKTVIPGVDDMERTVETLFMVRDFVENALKIDTKKPGVLYENYNT
jgi:hypothetical protein